MYVRRQFSGTSAGCPAIQRNSDTICLEIVSDPTGRGLSPTRLLPPAPQFHTLTHTHTTRMCFSGQSQSHVISCPSDQLAINSNDFLLGFNYFAKTVHRTEALTFASLLKNGDEQFDWDIHRVKPGRVPSTGASVPVELESVPSQCGCVH